MSESTIVLFTLRRCMQRCLLLASLLYFQFSTYTLLQWAKQRMPSETTRQTAPTKFSWVASLDLGVPRDSPYFNDARAPIMRPLHSPVPAESSAASAAAAARMLPPQPQTFSPHLKFQRLHREEDVAFEQDQRAEMLPRAEAEPAAGEGAPVENAEKVASWIESEAYGKFIGVSTFFNPGRYENKVDNFRKFRRSVSAQGLRMLCVELAFGLAQHQLAAADCDIMVHRRTALGNTLWQKERLLNVALEVLPKTVEKVMWLDSDLIFLNDNWVPETAELLDQFPVVQPFGWMTYLPADAGIAYAEEKLATLPLGQGVGGVYHSAGLGISSFGDVVYRANFILGHPGFAWAARREVITASGFYDRSVIGGGDRIMVNAFTGRYGGVSRKMPMAMAVSIKRFGSRLTPFVGPANVSYTQGVVLHIWHGDRANRDYRHRCARLIPQAARSGAAYWCPNPAALFTYISGMKSSCITTMTPMWTFASTPRAYLNGQRPRSGCTVM